MNAADQPEGRTRTEQRQATRTALIEAGARAFAAKGHDGVNLAKDILEPVGVSVGSFYHQFQNKTDLLLAIIDQATEAAETRFYRSLPQDGSGMDQDDVSALWSAYLSLVDDREDVVTIQLREAHSPHPEIADAIKRLSDVRREVLAVRYREVARPGVSVDAEAMAEMGAALSLGALTTYLHTTASDRPRRKAELVERLTTMVLSGMVGFIDDDGGADQGVDEATTDN